MKEYLNEYNVELETIGPVFVGSGREIHKKEYLFGNNEISVMDIPRLFSFIQRNGLQEKFESFFLDDRKKDLSRFLRENNIRPDEVTEYIRYSVSQSDTSLERGTPISVMEFVKDPYGMPYIPGSSIKGMLRTVLLASEIESNKERYVSFDTQFKDGIRKGGRRNIILKKEEKSLESAVFNKLKRNEKRVEDAVNDVLSGLILSDSRPLAVKDMVLCQRVEYHVNGNEKNLNVLRECIKPGTKIRFKLTIDSSICTYSKEDIIDAIRRFSSIYNDSFRTRFADVPPGGPDSVYLGGGVGFVSKTIIYPLFGPREGLDVTVDIFDKTRVPSEHKHDLDSQDGVSPHILKVTRYMGSLYQMGECRWRFV